MSEIREIVSNLRSFSGNTSPSNMERTKLEKLATIAIIHDEISKTASKSRLLSLAKGLALAAPAVGAGVYGYSSGKEKGKHQGRKEMYMAAAPYVYRARRQAAILEQLANRAGSQKKASVKKMLGAAALAAPAYFGAGYFGRRSGSESGKQEVLESAKQDISRSRLRALLAARKIRMLRSRMAQASREKGGQ